MEPRRGIDRIVSAPILAGCLTGCWWPFGLVAILMALDPWAPTWLRLACALAWLAVGGFTAARFVRPWFALLVLAVHASLSVYTDQTVWSDVRPSLRESAADAGGLAAPWLVGALLGGWRRRRQSRHRERIAGPPREDSPPPPRPGGVG